MNKKTWIVFVIFAALLAGLVMGNLLARRAMLNTSMQTLSGMFNRGSKIDEMLGIISSQYVDTTNVDELIEDLAVDLAKTLDPHTVYIPAKDLAEVNSELEGTFSGIGVQFNIQNDTIMIVSVISGGPSEKVGLLAGDRIIAVNDTAFVGKEVTNEKVMTKLRGKKDTEVKLTIKRNSTKDKLHFTVTRGDIPVNSVTSSYIISPGIGFIGVEKFAINTYAEFLDAIATLQKQGAKKFIVDLRSNSGGMMDQVVKMVNEFLPANQMIVYAEGKAYPRIEENANGKGSCINSPIAVLIDDFSASASEIFAGAIQDNDRGVIIGRRSFGKGLVQQQIPLRDGSAFRLTVARYYTPSGRSIQKPYVKGNSEDYELDLLNRYKHGEFFNQDSVHVADTLVYKTIGGRKVFGGGGIMPDIFVPRDTTEYSPFLNKVTNYGSLYQFAFQYTDKNRTKLSTYKTWQDLKHYLDAQPLLSEFIAFAATKGIQASAKDIATSRHLMVNLLESYIIRNILGDQGFYPVFYQRDKTVLKAVEELKKSK